ncbi:MAG: hypothetical protein U9N14_06700, partial [Pseudomonadota bacterium]|nr:hypothetical protein [Pseudomonadota bacterium]
MSSRLPILIVVLMVSAPATADIQVASDYFIRQVLQDPIREDVQHILDQNDDEGDGGGDPINAAPTISAIDDVIKAAGTSTNWIDFVIGDDESDAGDLILTKASSNETLVPPANIVLSTGADPANRRVRVTLAAGQTGYADITLTVSDGDKTAEEVFRITANTAPTIGTLDDQIIDMDSNTGAMAFSIGDAETGVDDLTLTKSSSNETLVSLSGIVFGGSGASRNVTVTPATGQTGSVEIIIGVSDGEMTATDPFTLTVNMTAGGVWIDVPTTIIGDGTSVPAFSVMKYEAKNDGTGNAISQAGGLPFATIDLPTMIIKCENLGGGSHLITETE